MRDERVDELVNLTLDGEATTSEAAELRGRAEQSEEIRREIAAHQVLFARLEESGRVPVPASIAADVMERIRSSQTQSGASVIPFRPRARHWAIAAAAAAAVIGLAIIAPSIGEVDDAERARLAGTMVAPAAAMREVAQVTASTGASASLLRDGRALELRVKLPDEGQVAISWDPAAVVPESPVTSGDRVVLLCPLGRCPSLRFLKPNGSTASFSLSVPGNATIQLDEPQPRP